MLIRVIEAFKLVDLPNIMTAGGPGIATESMTLHAFFAWRSTDLAQAAAISYCCCSSPWCCASRFSISWC